MAQATNSPSAGHRPLPGSDDTTALGDERAAAHRAARWGTLPPRPREADLVEEIPADPPNDPEGGLNPDRDWMLRYAS